MKNILFLVIDALRHDITDNKVERAILMPNIDKLVERGFMSRVVANSATTQFVLPALLSQTYPLDFGGYDTGIRQRPKSFVELFRDAGYFTYLATSCNQYGLTHGYDRGFDSVRGLYSSSGQIRRLILRRLQYEISLWDSGKKTESEVISVIQNELGMLLEKLKNQKIFGPRLPLGWRKAERHNRGIMQGCQKELEILATDPMVVVNKIRELSEVYYWTALGETCGGRHQKFVRWGSRFLWGMELMVSRFGFNIPKFGAFQFPVELVVSGLADILDNKRPWFAYIHVMDVHSYFFYRGIVDSLRKLRFLPRLLAARRRGLCKRPLLHDLALMQIDYSLGRALEKVNRSEGADETVVVVIGDHGKHFPKVDSRPVKDVPQRTFREHIDTAFIMAGAETMPDRCDGLLDSMSVSSTLLQAMNISSHPSFKGISAFDGGRDYVISENAGRGSGDIERKDLFFTITNNTRKLMTGLFETSLTPIALYDLTVDPMELNDVKDDDSYKEDIEALLEVIRCERAEILEARVGSPRKSGTPV